MADQENHQHWEDLPSDLMEHIFLSLPFEALLNFRLTSTTMSTHTVIAGFRVRHAPVTNTGLVVVLSRHYISFQGIPYFYYRDLFLSPREGQPMYPMTVGFEHYFFPLILVASCNGFLLYDGGAYNLIFDHFHCLSYVVLKQHEWGQAKVGLVYEGFGSNFQLVYIFYKEDDILEGWMNCRIFSSERGEWSSIRARIHNVGLVTSPGFNREMWFGASLYYDGRLYWIWSLCMLRYDIRNETFTLYPLPCIRINMFYPQLLYESAGRIYYCFLRYSSLRVFSFRSDGRFPWQPRWSVRRHQCPRHLRLQWSEIRPVAFNQDLQQLILVVRPRMIVSYSLETSRFASEWLSQDPGTQIQQVLPLLFRSETSSRVLWRRID